MPFQDGFSKRKVPLIIYLKSKKDPCHSSDEKSRGQNYIPEFLMKLK
jgi:hypothetical protein